MKKILVFGDSHVGSLKAIQNLEISNSAQCDMIGFPGPISTMLDFSNGTLKMSPDKNFEKSSHGHSSDELKKWYLQSQAMITTIDNSGSIDLASYDCIIIYGGHLIYRQWWKFPTVKDFYSSGFKYEITKELLSKTIHFGWLDKVKKSVGNNVKVFSMPEPILNELVLGYAGEIAQNTDYLKLIPTEANYFEHIELLGQVFGDLGSTFLPLPELLYKNNNSVSAKYKSTDPRDFIHLSSEGARLVLKNVLDVV